MSDAITDSLKYERELMMEKKWLDPNVPSRVWTIGYGITTKEGFVNRLKAAFPDRDAVIIDIRKEGSGSRNVGSWANWGSEYMGETVKLSGNRYLNIPALASKHGKTKAGLLLYRDELIDGWKRPHLDVLVEMMKDDPKTKYCFMCCERKPFAGAFSPRTKCSNGEYIGWESWSGKENCHRVVAAGQVVARMNYDYNLAWFTRHLYTPAVEEGMGDLV